MSKKLYSLLAFFLLLNNISVAQKHTKGCLKSTIDTSMVEKKKFVASRGEMPNSYSLERYAPRVRSQGDISSCVSWASAYTAFTIVKRLEKDDYSLEPFAPLNLYNRIITKNESDCSSGTGIPESLNMLKDDGCAFYSEYEESCGYEGQTDYSEKLYDWNFVSVTSYNFKQALINNNPIVISMTCFINDDGWESSENLENGVWNGYHGEVDTENGHAMCIVGFDDDLRAFQVMNSWGTDWGDNGYFWIRYSDIEFIDLACVLEYSKTIEDNSLLSNVNAGNIRIDNKCSSTAYVTLSQKIDGDWVTKGWYPIYPNGTVMLDISEREENTFFWMANNKSLGIYWYDRTGDLNFCYDPTHEHVIVNQEPCPTSRPFYRETPDASTIIHYEYLTCPIMKSRGDDQPTTVLLSNELKYDGSEPLTANYYWEPIYPLFDATSTNLILPNDEGKFDVYLLNDSKEISHQVLSASDLSIQHAYKFSSLKNAETFLNR